jgi:hypothetical protein
MQASRGCPEYNLVSPHCVRERYFVGLAEREYDSLKAEVYVRLPPNLLDVLESLPNRFVEYKQKDALCEAAKRQQSRWKLFHAG